MPGFKSEVPKTPESDLEIPESVLKPPGISYLELKTMEVPESDFEILAFELEPVGMLESDLEVPGAPYLKLEVLDLELGVSELPELALGFPESDFKVLESDLGFPGLLYLGFELRASESGFEVLGSKDGRGLLLGGRVPSPRRDHRGFEDTAEGAVVVVEGGSTLRVSWGFGTGLETGGGTRDFETTFLVLAGN